MGDVRDAMGEVREAVSDAAGEVRGVTHGAITTAQDAMRKPKRVARAGVAAVGVSGPVPRWLFKLLGRRYPLAILAIQFTLAHVVIFFAVLLLTLYVPMSLEQFLRILVLVEALMLVENAVATKISARMLRPVRSWIDGARDEESTIRAWRALAELPAEFLRRWGWVPVLLNIPVSSLFISFELDLPVFSVPLLMFVSLGVFAYGATLRYFAMELAMRPVLEQVSRELPEDFELGPGGVRLKWKLLAVLPMINVITGVVVAGLSRDGRPNLSDLGVDVALAVVVAFTIALEVNVLMSRAILTPLQNLRQATERLASGDLSARVAVVSTDETGRLSHSFNQMAAGLEERERLREAFGAFVDPYVADRIMREGALEGDELEVTVLFLDIRDFTTYAEQASAREVVARLNDFYERVVPVLSRHGGHANKFIGDGLLGVFGAPVRQRDHADRAVVAALEIARVIERTYGDELRIGIGVNSGPVLAGTVGGGGRLDFTVIGDPVNTASRVEEMTRDTGDTVLITEATRCLLEREVVELEERPEVELKGKTERVRLWAPAAAAATDQDDGAGRVRDSIAGIRRRVRPGAG
jgi:adenylate cyclase